MAHTPPGRTREKVWRFVRERLLAGDPPTVREVQEAFGFRAVESARAHLTALVEAGLLVQETGRSRGWRLPSHGPGGGASRPVMVPVLGRVQAGALTTALEETEGMVAATPVPGAELFALRVRGDSMRGAGILDGDLVIVRRQEAAADGEIVVALVGDEATVKRLRWGRGAHAAARAGGSFGVPPSGGRTDRSRKGARPAEAGTPNEPQSTSSPSRVPELHPENPDFPVIVPPPGELRILGKVIEVRRHLDTSSSTAETTAPWDAWGA